MTRTPCDKGFLYAQLPFFWRITLARSLRGPTSTILSIGTDRFGALLEPPLPKASAMSKYKLHVRIGDGGLSLIVPIEPGPSIGELLAAVLKRAAKKMGESERQSLITRHARCSQVLISKEVRYISYCDMYPRKW